MLYSLSMYLARLTLGSIGVTNKGATTIMAWLNKIAAIVCLIMHAFIIINQSIISRLHIQTVRSVGQLPLDCLLSSLIAVKMYSISPLLCKMSK